MPRRSIKFTAFWAPHESAPCVQSLDAVSSLLMPPSPASPFAALLRRSKFASYDTSIAQIYTASGGDLSRGNWGLKRPLPLRRKGAHITVKAVDSKEQQTEWDLADQQGRWIQMWDEVGISPTLGQGQWERRLGMKVNASDEPFDSDYSRDVREEEMAEDSTLPKRQGVLTRETTAAEKEKANLLRMLEAGPGASMPNIHSMSDSEFDKYLEKVREMRPTFLAYRNLVADANRRSMQETVWQDMSADHDSHMFKTFLAKNAENDISSPSSRTIEQQPQRVAGLTYTKSSLLQSQLLTQPRPGRLAMRNKTDVDDKGAENTGSFAGMLPHVSDTHRGDTTEVIDWRKLATATPFTSDKDSGDFRLINASLHTAPTVVRDIRNKMKDIVLYTDIKAVTKDDLAPQKKPGTREYSGKTKTKAKDNQRMFAFAPGPPKKQHNHFVSTQVGLTRVTSGYADAGATIDSLETLLQSDSKRG